VVGRADETGVATYDDALADARAQVVRRRLLLEGVEASRVRATYYGEPRLDPLDTPGKVYGGERRVEFLVRPRPAAELDE